MKNVIITIDVESDYPPIVEHSMLGIEIAMPRIMDVLKSEQVPANLFFLADLCKFFPSLPKEIIQNGFKLGNHSLHHRLLCLEKVADQWQDIERSTQILEEHTNSKITSFRAPNFSLNEDTISCLERANYRFDSSILPGRRLKRFPYRYAYDFRGAPTVPYYPSKSDIKNPGSSQILEVPVTENPLNREAPIGSGFLNIRGVEVTYEAIRESRTSPIILVLHPWEFVNLNEKIPGLPKWTQFGCREGFGALSQLIEKLKESEWKFITIEDVPKFYDVGKSG